MKAFESSSTRRSILLGLIVLSVLFLWGASPAVGADGDEGSASGISLRIDPGARSSALGSAYVAKFNDPLSVHFNPAGLGSQMQTESLYTHFQVLDEVEGISLNHLSMATPIARNEAGFGVSLTSLDYGDLRRTEVNENLNPIRGLGSFGAGDLSASGSLGVSLTDSLKAGLSATYFRSSIAEFDASTVTGDVGFQYHIVPNSMVVGLAGRNIGGGIKFVQEEDPLPTVYDLGISSALKMRGGADVLSLSGDLVFPSDADLYFAGGVEYGFYRTLFLRAGYNGSQEADDGFTLGLGVHDRRFKINYSFQPAGNLGNNQRLTLSYIFGGVEPEEEKPEEEPDVRRRTPPEQRGNGLRELLHSEENYPYLKPTSENEWLAEHQNGKEAYRNGNYVEARNHFLRAYRTKPAEVENLLWLGTMEWYLGRRERAVRHMKQVLKIDPDNDVAQRNLSRMREARESEDG